MAFQVIYHTAITTGVTNDSLGQHFISLVKNVSPTLEH